MASIINALSSGAGGLVSSGDTSGVLQLQNNSSASVTLDASGNVGIGTASPAGKLDVNGTIYGGKNGTSRGYVSIQSSGDTAHTGYIEFLAPNGTRQGYLGYADVSGSGQFNLWGESSTNALAFATNSTERMRIDTSGRVCINNTTSAGGQPLYVKALTGVGSAGFQVWQNASGAIDWYNASATYVASVIVNASSVAYNTTSDYRLKDDIVPITGALDKVAQLKPVNWKWKLDGSDGQGFIAHELQAVIPDAVSGEKDAVDAEGNPKYQGVDTSFLVATLTAAIQEQQTIINDLKARVTALEAK